MDIFRAQLHGFYSTIKAKNGQIRFCLLTGVSKIGKMSVFSGLNNLRDISMLPEYNDICGISEDELHRYFDGAVEELAQALEDRGEFQYRITQDRGMEDHMIRKRPCWIRLLVEGSSFAV